MTPRINVLKYLPSAPAQALLRLGQEVSRSGLEPSIVHLVEIRASQLNGCAYCIDMHTKDARAAGETEQRIYGLDAWREAPYYNERERAALEWTEAVTRLAGSQVPDDAFERARQQFEEPQLVALTFAITTVNTWNRLNIAFRTPAGSYQPQHAVARST